MKFKTLNYLESSGRYAVNASADDLYVSLYMSEEELRDFRDTIDRELELRKEVKHG